jgi:hypothetical protein
MTFPTSTIPTNNLDNGADDPSQARANLLTAVQNLNSIITDKNSANGVVVLEGDGTIQASLLPTTITTPTNTLTLAPANSIVNIQNFLRLQNIPKTTLTTIVGNAGDLAVCSNADAGGIPALAISDGVDWYFLPKASLTKIV